jgi:hypothetical protein
MYNIFHHKKDTELFLNIFQGCSRAAAAPGARAVVI